MHESINVRLAHACDRYLPQVGVGVAVGSVSVFGVGDVSGYIVDGVEVAAYYAIEGILFCNAFISFLREEACALRYTTTSELLTPQTMHWSAMARPG
jgi:hypothetical protein